MIILHLGWNKDKLLLWGETSGAGQKKIQKNKNGKKDLKIKCCPFSASAEEISAALKDIYDINKKDISPAIVWLPAKNNTPIASSPVIAESSQAGGKPSIKPRLIDSIAFDAKEIIEFISFSFDKDALPRGVFIGNDFAFWAKAVNFAAALTAKGRYIPNLSNDDGAFRAVWEPVFIGPDAEYLKKLADVMPPSALAVSDLNCAAPPSFTAAKALKEFTAKIVDRIVRMSILEKERKIEFDSVHDAWVAALKSDGGAVSGDKTQLAQFYSHLRDWTRPVYASLASPLRLCFRIEEPGEGRMDVSENGKWNIRYLLQSAEDPGILISAQDIWQDAHGKSLFFKRNKFDAKEYLLIALGQAAGICPEIEKSFKAPCPREYKLDLAGISKFLVDTAPALEQAGFGVLFPAWWTGRGNKQALSVNAKVKTSKLQSKAGLSFDQIINFDWEAAVGGENLSLQELRELAKLKAPLVKLRGKWVYLNAQDLQNVIAFLSKNTEGAVSLRELVKMRIGAVSSAEGVAFGGVKARGELEKLLKQVEESSGFEELAPPGGFNGVLRPYQARGYSWLAFMRKWRLGACLADDMGLGKTIQALTMIQMDWESNIKNRKPVLLICPTSVVNNWNKESARFTPKLPVMIHHGGGRAKSESFKKAARKHAVVISSYSLLHRDIEHLRQVDWAGVILDEAQNIKNQETKQAKSARELKSGYRIALTGTPVENHVGELWSIMEFLNPGFLGGQSEFKRKFLTPIHSDGDSNAANCLRRITSPFILRRVKTDKSIISDLPEKIETKVFCVLTKEQASLYAAVVNEAEKTLETAEDMERKGVILATLSKLKQVCNHPAQFLADNSSVSNRSGKLQRITEMLEEIIDEGAAALIFTQFAQMGLILKRHLEEVFGQEVPFLYGGTARKNRDNMVEKFQSAGGPRIFIVSLKAGGTGLNLTRASHVFHFDRWWNPAVENQATDRAFRIGQNRNVQVHKFICSGTVEERIDEMIERKTQIASRVVSSGEKWLTEMNNDELKKIFELRKEAVGD